MAYPDLTETNETLRQSFANKPVVPNAPADAQPSGVGHEFGVDTPGYSPAANTAAKASVGIGGSIDYGKEFGITPQPGPTGSVGGPPAVATPAAPAAAPQDFSTRSYTVPGYGGGGEPVITPDALRPRTAGNDTRTTEQVNRESRAQLDVINAREAQGVREATEAMRAGGARAQAGYNADQLKREAEFARFRAQNGADVVLGTGGDKRRYAAAADAAEARAAAAAGGVENASVIRPDRGNLVADALATQGAADRAALTTNQQNKDVIGNAVEKQKLEHAQRLNQLGAAITGAKTPAEREKASKDLLTLLGKDKPEEYQVIHAAGGSRLAPDGYTVLRDPDRIAIVHKQTGKTEFVGGGGQEGGAQKAAPPQNHIQALRQDPAKYKAQFEAKYGAGSAAQYLGQ